MVQLTNAAGRHRVVVTGFGAVTCLGLTAEETWSNLVAGRCGIRKISRFDATGFEVSVAGEISGFNSVEQLGPDWAYLGDRFSQIGLAAALQAARHAGLDPDAGAMRQAAVITANAHSDMSHYGAQGWEFARNGGVDIYRDGVRLTEGVIDHISRRAAPYRIDPDLLYRQNYDYTTHLVAKRFNTRGPLFTVSSACVSGAKAVERGVRWLQRGHCHVALCGGSEAVVDQFGIWLLHAMRALTTYAADPHHASRPFDRDRSGFVLAEGAGFLILETLEHALRRDARIYAEVVGVGGSANANSLFAPEPVGDGVAGAMLAAMRHGGVAPKEIDMVAAHATATGIGDPAEADGIRIALQDHAPNVAITASKSMMGHAIAASGALGAIQCVQAIRDNVVPPIINLDNPDSCCEGLHMVANVAEPRPVNCAINNAFGFGGSNGSNIFRRFAG